MDVVSDDMVSDRGLMSTEAEMNRNNCSPLEHLAGVAAVVGLSMVLHTALTTGSVFFAPERVVAAGPASHIAAPASADWGHAVLRLNGMP